MTKIGKLPAERQEQAVNDIINHPKHYRLFPDMEAIEVIEAVLTPEEFAGYLKGNALKYRLRAGDKGPEEICIGKARWYQDRLVEHFDSWKPATIKAFEPSSKPCKLDWPNESRRTEQQETAEDKAWREIEERMDVIGTNGNGGEHYPLLAGCTACFGKGRVAGVYGHTGCPACKGASRG